jgi:hypothetical protein
MERHSGTGVERTGVQTVPFRLITLGGRYAMNGLALRDAMNVRRLALRMLAMLALFGSCAVAAQPTPLKEAGTTDERVPPAKAAKMEDVVRGVFGDRVDPDANPFVSRYRWTFQDVHKSFADRAGRFQRVLEDRTVETPQGEYFEARGKWEKAVMCVRLTFDDAAQVTGFWLARDPEGPTPNSAQNKPFSPTFRRNLP